MLTAERTRFTLRDGGEGRKRTGCRCRERAWFVGPTHGVVEVGGVARAGKETKRYLRAWRMHTSISSLLLLLLMVEKVHTRASCLGIHCAVASQTGLLGRVVPGRLCRVAIGAQTSVCLGRDARNTLTGKIVIKHYRWQ